MMHFRIAVLAGALSLTQAYSVPGNASIPDFGFGSPEVMKLDWATRSLNSADLDQDGLKDLVVVNNDAGRIELLYQLPPDQEARKPARTPDRSRWEPILEDAQFEKRSLTVGFPIFDLVVADLNSDGRLDLAYTSGEIPLTILYQDIENDWVDSQVYDGFEALGWTNSIHASDVDRDGAAELFVLSSDAIRIFRQSGEDGLGEPQVLYVSGENPFNMMLCDVSGDGLEDLLYLATDGKQVLAMRHQTLGGQFGPESRYVMERPARVMMPQSPDRDGAVSLVSVNSRSGSLEFMRLAAPAGDEGTSKSSLEQGSPAIYPIFKKVRRSASYALGDLDGDGDQDMIVASPSEAELVLFEKSGVHFQVSPSFPTFSEVSSLSTGRFFKGKRQHLIVLSKAEKTMGFSELDSKGRLTFPRRIQFGEGEPLVSAVCDVDGDGFDELILVRKLDGEYSLLIVAPSNREEADHSWKVLFEMGLKDVRREPVAIRALDCFDSGLPGLMLFVPREPPILLRPGPEAKGIGFEIFADSSTIRESLLHSLEPPEIAFFDLSGDGVNELVVARTGFSRAFKVVGDDLEMVDQLNARRGSDVIEAVIPIKSEDGIDAIALYAGNTGELQFLRRDASGVFRYDTSVKVGRLDLEDWFRLPPQGDGQGEAFIFTGEERFWYFGGDQQSSEWEIQDVYETDLEDIHYSHVASADFDQDGIPELVAIDGSENIVDILRLENGVYRSLMFWKVFEVNMHYQGRTGAQLEPRQILIDDWTGDGYLDLSLLVHDRILIYPQE